MHSIITVVDGKILLYKSLKDWCKECPLFNSPGAYSGGRLQRVGADSRGHTVYRNDFLILVPTLGIGVET
jgi:hypothetical protein